MEAPREVWSLTTLHGLGRKEGGSTTTRVRIIAPSSFSPSRARTNEHHRSVFAEAGSDSMREAIEAVLALIQPQRVQSAEKGLPAAEVPTFPASIVLDGRLLYAHQLGRSLRDLGVRPGSALLARSMSLASPAAAAVGGLGGGRLLGGAPKTIEAWLEEKYGGQDPATVTEIEGAPKDVTGECAVLSVC